MTNESHADVGSRTREIEQIDRALVALIAERVEVGRRTNVRSALRE